MSPRRRGRATGVVAAACRRQLGRGMVNGSLTLLLTAVVLRLGVATLLGVIVGLERERLERAAGLRTHALVALASALMMLVSAYSFADLPPTPRDPTRMAAQVVSGIGFLGAGRSACGGIPARSCHSPAGAGNCEYGTHQRSRRAVCGTTSHAVQAVRAMAPRQSTRSRPSLWIETQASTSSAADGGRVVPNRRSGTTPRGVCSNRAAWRAGDTARGCRDGGPVSAVSARPRICPPERPCHAGCPNPCRAAHPRSRG